jgi:acetylornithine deacetylase/succinyl-diaminopimelate desuccinylase-like protein
MLPGPGIDCEAEIQPAAASRGSRISPGDADPSKHGPPAYRLGVDVSISEVELLQSYVRFDTTKPPGHERACIELGGLLEQARIEHRYAALEVERPNLIARIPGRGEAALLLLYGHVDVVAADPGEWRHPPFGAEFST